MRDDISKVVLSSFAVRSDSVEFPSVFNLGDVFTRVEVEIIKKKCPKPSIISRVFGSRCPSCGNRNISKLGVTYPLEKFYDKSKFMGKPLSTQQNVTICLDCCHTTAEWYYVGMDY